MAQVTFVQKGLRWVKRIQEPLTGGEEFKDLNVHWEIIGKNKSTSDCVTLTALWRTSWKENHSQDFCTYLSVQLFNHCLLNSSIFQGYANDLEKCNGCPNEDICNRYRELVGTAEIIHRKQRHIHFVIWLNTRRVCYVISLVKFYFRHKCINIITVTIPG